METSKLSTTRDIGETLDLAIYESKLNSQEPDFYIHRKKSIEKKGGKINFEYGTVDIPVIRRESSYHGLFRVGLGEIKNVPQKDYFIFFFFSL